MAGLGWCPNLTPYKAGMSLDVPRTRVLHHIPPWLGHPGMSSDMSQDIIHQGMRELTSYTSTAGTSWDLTSCASISWEQGHTLCVLGISLPRLSCTGTVCGSPGPLTWDQVVSRAERSLFPYDQLHGIGKILSNKYSLHSSHLWWL